MFCVSKTLICDGIRHCPVGSEYENDENAEMCSRHKTILENVCVALENSISIFIRIIHT